MDNNSGYSVRACISVVKDGQVLPKVWCSDWNGLSLRMADIMRKELEARAEECVEKYAEAKFGRGHQLISALNALLGRKDRGH